MKKGKAGKNRFGLLGGIALILNILAAIALIISYLSVYISPEKSWVLPFFGLLYPYLALLNILFVLYWALRFRWLFVISLVTVLAGWNHLGRTYQFGQSAALPEDRQMIRLVSYNVKNLSNDNVNLLDPEIRDNIIKYLQDMGPDVLCLQEFAVIHPDPDLFIDSISQLLDLPYHAYVVYSEKTIKRLDAIFTFSRFPIIHSEGLKKDDTHHYALLSDIAWGDDTIRLYNVHLESVRLRHEDYQFISDLDLQFQESGNIKEGSRRILRKLRTAFSKRAWQVDRLSSGILHSPYPVILCGDFNDTPNSYSYQKLTKHLSDAFTESGHGFGNTYIGKLPSFRIDYILYDEYFSAWEFRRDLVRFSDHYPVTCFIGFREGKMTGGSE